MKIELTPEQVQANVNLLDFAIRQGGSQVAVVALPIMGVLGAAMQAHAAEQAAAQAAEAKPAEAPAPAVTPAPTKPARRK